jgi:aspartyl-tRNA(Asn)/glutamyl-tRNA(Gln) amidotransferase subunit A
MKQDAIGAVSSSACQQLKMLKSGEISPVDLVASSLHVAEENRHLNFIELADREALMSLARASEKRWSQGSPLGRLDGIPVTIKDNCLVNGRTTRWGSKVKTELAQADSPPVARLREQGALIVGYTTLPEWGWKGVSDSPLTGVTRNPWNQEMTSGGSSGGAAVSAALGVASLNLGSDGAGSIRIPASFCGVFGFKPTGGLVPGYPVSALPSFVTYGPITQTVADAQLMLDVIQQPDNRDWLALPFSVPPSTRPTRFRAAYSRTLGYAQVDQQVVDVTDAAVAVLRESGWDIVETDPGFGDPFDIIYPLYFGALSYMVGAMDASQRKQMDQALVAAGENAASVSGNAIFDALVKRDALGRFMNGFHEKFDFLITPQMPLTAFEAGRDFPADRGMQGWFDWNQFTYPFNLTQQPAASLPCGIAADGMPVGLQIVGRRYADQDVMAACAAFESALPFAALSVTLTGLCP